MPDDWMLWNREPPKLAQRENPCSKMKRNARPKSTKRYSETITLLDLDQIKTLLRMADAEGHQSAALTHVLVKAGLRKNEAGGMQWKDIDFTAGTLTITRQLVVIGPEPIFGPPKSGKGPRHRPR
jgi:integrase